EAGRTGAAQVAQRHDQNGHAQSGRDDCPDVALHRCRHAAFASVSVVRTLPDAKRRPGETGRLLTARAGYHFFPAPRTSTSAAIAATAIPSLKSRPFIPPPPSVHAAGLAELPRIGGIDPSFRSLE